MRNQETEPMQFREAVQYGIQELIRRRLERDRNTPAMPPQFAYDLLAPSALGRSQELPESGKHAVNVAYQKQRRAEGKTFDEELVAEAEMKQAERERFKKSKFHKLFPMLKTTRKIHLDI